MNQEAQVIGVTLAITQLIKETFGLKGAAARIAGVVTGTIVGILFKLSAAVPADYATWFSIGLYGLVLGLTTAGLYAVADRAVDKIADTD